MNLLSERELIAYMFTAKSIRVIPCFTHGTSTFVVIEHKHYTEVLLFSCGGDPR